MRKYSLRQTANQYLKLGNQGSYKVKKQRAYVIHKMIDDLYTLGDVPSSWKNIQAHHIHQLVDHWKKSKIRAGTIMNHYDDCKALSEQHRLPYSQYRQ